MLRIVYCKLLRKIPLEYLITDSQCTCPFGLFLIWRGVPNLPQLHVFFMAPFITDETPVNLEFPAFVTKNGTLFGNNDNWAEFIFRYKFELALLVNLLLYDCCSSLCTVCICGCSLSDVRGQGRISLSLKKKHNSTFVIPGAWIQNQKPLGVSFVPTTEGKFCCCCNILLVFLFGPS